MLEQIGRYEIKRELGRGGMATVYLAYDPIIQRLVAIKLLPRQFTHDPKFLDRFEREGRTIAKLEHPAIVSVYDFGEHGDTPYLVMRYMAGGSLRGRLNGGPLSLEEIAPALERLAPALDYAHELGIVHRDLKPANILFDYEGRPYLADFGIARLADATGSMTAIGTPGYMSPEQVRGRPVDKRTDVWAFGCLMYEMLTGYKAFDRETVADTLAAIIDYQPRCDLLPADTPKALEDLLCRSLDKRVSDRLGSIREVRHEIEAILASI